MSHIWLHTKNVSLKSAEFEQGYYIFTRRLTFEAWQPAPSAGWQKLLILKDGHSTIPTIKGFPVILLFNNKATHEL